MLSHVLRMLCRFLLILPSMGGCVWTSSSNVQQPVQQKRTITLSEKENGHKVEANPGDILVLKLEARLGTGYSWATVENDVSRLKPIGESIEQSGTVEAEETEFQIFLFEALREGTTTLELQYRRPWEKGVSPLKNYRIKVQIQ